MKFKKAVITLLAVIGLGTLGASATQPVAASTSKADVIKVTENDLSKADDAQATIKLGLKIGKKQIKFNIAMTMGNKPTVIHVLASSKALPSNVESWIDSGSGKIYSLDGKKWVKEDMSKEDQASFNDATQGKPSPTFYKKLAKKAKLTQSGDSYTVSGKVTDQKWLNKFILAIAKDAKLSKKEIKSLKKVKLNNISVKMTTSNDKLTNYLVSTKVSMTKKMAVTLSMNMSEFGKHSDLAVPSEIVNSATQAPKD
ncbi:hypothetical protein PT281_00895 [Lactobacillus sp. ESL0701]|uniref:hypothetical protein n=1 Tax=Lactobacillus sp. ESL0701 TaxID=2983217 RepID=UPI0023F99D99|nr:hypothetical protein [Lactobacillus sp. ESL0701]MDF7671843.1 hypothetical protein [Lactobacillus sp. ESL0701]